MAQSDRKEPKSSLVQPQALKFLFQDSAMLQYLSWHSHMEDNALCLYYKHITIVNNDSSIVSK
jgi:hypothetical protein